MKIMTETDRCMDLELARVLLVDDDPTSRLTLQTVLEASGYHVDSAASAAEAVGKLDEQEYQLVLSDLQMESPEAGLKVLAHARMMDYKPATAIVTTYQNAKTSHTNASKAGADADQAGGCSGAAGQSRQSDQRAGRPQSAARNAPRYQLAQCRRGKPRLQIHPARR